MTHNSPPESEPIPASNRAIDAMIKLKKNAQYSHYLSLISLASMLSLFVFWNISRISGVNLPALAVQALPLLILLPGVIQRHYRSYSWLCFLMLMYFIFAVEGVFKSTATLSDYLFLLLVCTLFISAMMASRYLQRVQKYVTDTK